VEGSGSGLVKVFSNHNPGEIEEKHDKFRTAGLRAGFRTGKLPHAKQE
jgi:hypothetical protein